MLNRVIVINPIEPALLSIRSPLGIALDLGLTFQKQDGSPVDPDTLKPQIALMPRSSFGVWPFDVTTASSEQGLANVSVPGNVLMDPAGYSIELYARRTADNPANPPVPTSMLAKGVLRTEGLAYQQFGPLEMINVPTIVGPPGPAGPPGEAGQRGSMWFTGDGDPTETGGKIDGDMYLNNLNGDVWRFNGNTLMWVLGTF